MHMNCCVPFGPSINWIYICIWWIYIFVVVRFSHVCINVWIYAQITNRKSYFNCPLITFSNVPCCQFDEKIKINAIVLHNLRFNSNTRSIINFVVCLCLFCMWMFEQIMPDIRLYATGIKPEQSYNIVETEAHTLALMAHALSYIVHRTLYR